MQGLLLYGENADIGERVMPPCRSGKDCPGILAGTERRYPVGAECLRKQSELDWVKRTGKRIHMSGEEKGYGLTNPKAAPQARELYRYLWETWGKGILSGQQEDPRRQCSQREMDYIREQTGKLPAIRGLDYIHDDFEGVNKRAAAWHEQGGIVTVCWHWGAPPNGIGYPSSQGEIDMEEALREGSDLNRAVLERMDETARALGELRDLGIPVLWRPLHEFDGAWFWWGKGGPKAFVRLWRLMYDCFTRVHGLDNLIWVLGYCGEPKEGWYPGDDCVDIIGADTYREGVHEELYRRMEGITQKKMPIVYHENGPMPDPEVLCQKGPKWLWFMTWHTIHIMEQNTPEYLKKVYGHPYVITLDRLPWN